MNHYIYSNKGHNLINNIECKKKKREMFALYIFSLFPLPFICLSVGLNRENNAYLSEENVRSINNI